MAAKFKFSSLLSPIGIFFIYILASAIVIMAFRFIYPGQEVPLGCFTIQWRLIRGLLDFLSLFPALTLSSLVIPFGFILKANDRSSPFSQQFFQQLKPSVITAIVASALYGLVFSLVFPLAQNYEVNLVSQSQLYRHALEKAKENADENEWEEALQLLAICERIWQGGHEHSRLKIEAEIRTEQERFSSPDYRTAMAAQSPFPDNNPVNVTDALAMAEAALAEERYFDAHWLATLAGRLATPGSVEVSAADRLAGRAWSGVNSLAPNARETQAYMIYRLKREGYEAMVGEEWIRSFYIFQELLALTPKDPDAIKYYAASEEGVKQSAFFIDEIELSLGRILTGAIFSLPLGTGRLVMRVSSLSTSTDTAYGIDSELMAFNSDGQILWSMIVPYIKIKPLSLEAGPSLTIMLRALDREDQSKRWEPEISPSQGSRQGNEISLPVSWDTFLLLSNARRGLSGMSSTDLRKAALNLASCGYLPEVFEAELLQRFLRPLFLLPLGIFAIALGWQFRAHKRPRYIAIPMLGILPLVFNGAVYFSRTWLNDLGIWAVTSLGFTTSAIAFGAGIIVLLVLSLIYLASKQS